jgi:hypothetical protein
MIRSTKRCGPRIIKMNEKVRHRLHARRRKRVVRRASRDKYNRSQYEYSWGAAIMKVFVFATAVAVTTIWSVAAAQAEQATPRSVCCKQMGGRWVEGTSRAKAGQMVCAGVAADPYYKCVASKTR